MKKPISNNEILNSFNILLPYLPYFFDDDASFGIANTKTYLNVECNPNLKLQLKEGDGIPEGGAVYMAMQKDKVLVKNVPKEVYGVPFRSYAIPVHNEHGTVEGCIVIGKSLAKTNEITDVFKTLHAALRQITTEINSLSSGVQIVAGMNDDILLQVQEADKSSKDTDAILSFIQSISSKTNMLGLNAAIEAARAGDAGRGFKVVATEIRKLSTSTSESVKKVDDVLKNINASIKSINEKTSKSTALFEGQVETFNEIARSLEKLNLTGEMMENLFKKF